MHNLSNLIDEMKVFEANAFCFYLNLHYFHWNVEGQDFYQYHKFFQELYEEVHDSVDNIAEHIRALGAYAPGTIKRFMDLSELEETEKVLDIKEMLNALISNNDIVMASIKRALKEASTANERGVENFLQDRLDKHMKHQWMLKSSNK